jgi:glutathione synthase/RimK-type ligase-like ATP-grasp enzyme
MAEAKRRMNHERVAVLGLREDGPVHLLLEALRAEGVPTWHVDPRRFEAFPLDDTFSGLYLRPVDGQRLHARDAARGAACEQWTQMWCDLAEWMPGRVANRPSAMASNGSKPYQSQRLMALGFAVPPMLMTDDPDEVLAFEQKQGPLIFKSASGVRSIVRPLDDQARERLPLVRHCPTLFQQRLQGTNVRVHVVGREVFACEVDSDGLDYRYAGREGQSTDLRATTLDDRTRWLCIRAAHDLDLPFAGLDLLLADDGRTYCFEVNPSPGYSWYEDTTGQPIARSLARWLAWRSDTD